MSDNFYKIMWLYIIAPLNVITKATTELLSRVKLSISPDSAQSLTVKLLRAMLLESDIKFW